MKNTRIPAQARSWLALSLCFLILMISLFFALQNRSSTQKIMQREQTLTDVGFDTFVTYSQTADEAEFNRNITLVKEQFQYYNKLFDRYHTYEGIANLKTINDAAGQKAVQVEDALIECLMAARTFASYNTRFDVTQGELLDVWHTYREEGILLNEEGKDGFLPSDAELAQAYNADSWDAVIINADTNEVMIRKEGVSLDLGSIAKGYTVEKIKRQLQERGVTGAILNAGGNVVLIGDKTDGSAWKVGIQIPDKNRSTSSSIAMLELTGSQAIVTSGDYQRYYEVNGKRYPHIIDPSTLFPSTYMRSVTVICEDSTIADCISTTLFTMTYEEGVRYLEELQENGIQAEAVWIFDGTGAFRDQKYRLTQDGYTILATVGAFADLKV